MERKIVSPSVIFTYTENLDVNILNMLVERVENNLYKVKDFFKDYRESLEVTICTKNELNKIIANSTNVYGEENSIPNWVTGFYINGKVYVALLGEKDLDYISKVAIHELVHLLSDKTKHRTRRPKLLQEGLATYLSNQMSDNRRKTIINDYIENKLHKLDEYLNCNGLEFSNLNGYAYSYYAMEYCFAKYGKAKILHCLEYPEEFEEIVYDIKDEFEEYLKKVIQNI